MRWRMGDVFDNPIKATVFFSVAFTNSQVRAAKPSTIPLRPLKGLNEGPRQCIREDKRGKVCAGKARTLGEGFSR